MKRFILVGFLLAAFVGICQAQTDEEVIGIDDDESSGEAPNTNDNPFTDDEDLSEDSDLEGSGEPVVVPSTSTGEVTFETESTTTQAQEKESNPKAGSPKSKVRNVAEESEDEAESKEKNENNRELEEPVSRKDNSEETEDEVKDPAVASTSIPSTQFLVAVIVGGCIGLLFAICVIMLLVYRMRKKDEGSYALDYGLDKKPQGNYDYTKGVDSKEYFA